MGPFVWDEWLHSSRSRFDLITFETSSFRTLFRLRSHNFTAMTTADNADEILGTYKKMMADCQQIAAKISEVKLFLSPSSEHKVITHSGHVPQLSLERDEHKLVIEQLSTLESERKAFRLIGGILVEKTVGEALPAVQQNYEGVCCTSSSLFDTTYN